MSRASPSARRYVERVVRELRRDGVAQPQAEGRAWAMARQRGYRTR